MDEIVDLLREANTQVAWGLELPTHEMTVEAEEQILLPLPRDYREFLLTVSDVLVGSLEPAVVADPSAHNYLPEVCATAWSQGVPRSLIAFCQMANGYYCLDPEGEVLLWQDGDLTDESWETIWYWARDVWLES
ncbi:SMI1/KNR4 family protein [Simiduia sp. 21SJ11W-1]|uniref:SMI1/KNR4 family protein n=1 Tax=Simiduia sp. 21SJ11W-1 TaxID=2909669 RepID=UPI0020A155DE|nr:SMI1/KNR4 family protein [Simiduia sp. 21SJ11W-1]UTA46911.1 SMI1/KNR4 family protein [Simiduia sp. 21SJ11W-1]